MSKKSRKRNKKILAAIGIGLGAAALASRKPKQSDVSSDNLKRPRIETAKKDTAKKETTVTTPKTIQDNKYKGSRNTKSIRVKKNTNKIYTDATGGESTAKVGNEKSTFKGEDGYLRKGKDATPMTTGRFGTAKAASEISKGALPPQLRKPKASQTFGSGNDGLSYMAKGGRAGYKSGGSTGSSKASGCAIRGKSSILLKGKR